MVTNKILCLLGKYLLMRIICVRCLIFARIEKVLSRIYTKLPYIMYTTQRLLDVCSYLFA